VIGAHGGSGGEARDRSGQVHGTAETALDDAIGAQAFKSGFADASADHDGAGGNAETRMKLGKDVADAMGESPSYIPTVRDACDQLVRWVEKGIALPPSQTVKPNQRLQ